MTEHDLHKNCKAEMLQDLFQPMNWEVGWRSSVRPIKTDNSSDSSSKAGLPGEATKVQAKWVRGPYSLKHNQSPVSGVKEKSSSKSTEGQCTGQAQAKA